MLATFNALSGCSFVTVNSKPVSGCAGISPNGSRASVQILRGEPSRPHERLGEISLEPEGNPPMAEMEAKLKEAGAQMGADAVVIVADTTRIMAGT